MNIISRDGDAIVETAAAKANSRVTSNSEDTLWPGWINTAQRHVERLTGLVFQQSTCEQEFDAKTVDLKAPVRGIVSVVSYDDEQNATTLVEGDDYYFKKTNCFGAQISLVTEPEHYVVVQYVAGFGEYTAGTGVEAVNEGTIDPYPEAVTAVLLLTNHFYENRGTTTDFQKHDLPGGLERIINPLIKYT